MVLPAIVSQAGLTRQKSQAATKPLSLTEHSAVGTSAYRVRKPMCRAIPTRCAAVHHTVVRPHLYSPQIILLSHLKFAVDSRGENCFPPVFQLPSRYQPIKTKRFALSPHPVLVQISWRRSTIPTFRASAGLPIAVACNQAKWSCCCSGFSGSATRPSLRTPPPPPRFLTMLFLC
jgi:hypothetical protein